MAVITEIGNPIEAEDAANYFVLSSVSVVLVAVRAGAAAGLGALVLLASFVASGLAPITALVPGVPDLALWDVSRGVLAAWSLVLAFRLWQPLGLSEPPSTRIT